MASWKEGMEEGGCFFCLLVVVCCCWVFVGFLYFGFVFWLLFFFCICFIYSRVSGQNGESLLYIMLEIHHSGREPSIYFYII